MFFFFNDTATTEIYTLSLHDALPISQRPSAWVRHEIGKTCGRSGWPSAATRTGSFAPRCSMRSECVDRKSTRLNSSHLVISYAVFCLKKKKDVCLHSNTFYDKDTSSC